MIDSYAFGQMSVDGRHYRFDLIILPDRTVLHPWRRRAGHRLERQDLDAVIGSELKLLVAGTGMYGRMRLEASLRGELSRLGTELLAAPTAEATRIYNVFAVKQPGVAGCFHLSC